MSFGDDRDRIEIVRPDGPECKAWERKKGSITRQLLSVADRSPILSVVDVTDRGDEIRIMAVFQIPTLVVPRDGKVRTAGPVVVGIRYLEAFMTEPPLPWGIVTVLQPFDFYHPNSSPGGRGLCLGHPAAGIDMESILHLTYAALTLSSANCIEWEGMNPEAAQFVRSHAAEFPIVPTGLFERPPAHLLIGAGKPPSALRPAAGGVR
jgi:hypothetical protein